MTALRRFSSPMLLSCLLLAAASSLGQENSTWMVRIIGYGGRIDASLGPYNSHAEAQNSAIQWSQSRPNDLWAAKKPPFTDSLSNRLSITRSHK
jgi:hypothetical protein